MKSKLATLSAFLLAFSFSASIALAQETGQVSGTVTEDATGNPLPGVNVLLEGTQQGASTDADGTFRIENVEPGTYTLQASFVGYGEETQEGVEVRAGETATVDLVLQKATTGLDEVVVVGYGEQQRRDLTGSVSSVSSAELQSVPVAAADEALQGRVAGVQVTTGSRKPGGGLSIRIRGGNSVQGGNEPLYVIDGFPVYSGNIGASGPNVSPNPLNSINPSDIESIEILKDASATAIYGARGANGVVLITTKRGSAGDTRVNFSSYAGVQSVTNTYDLANAAQYAQMANEIVVARGQEPLFDDPSSFGEGTDWQDEVYEPAPLQNYQLSVSGGSESTQYLLSGNFYDQEGVIENSGFERYSLRANLDQEINSRLRVGNSLSISRTETAQTTSEGLEFSGAGVPQAAKAWIPIATAYNEEGNYTLHENVLPGTSAGEIPNPIAMINEIDDNITTDRVLGNVFAEYDLLDNLSLRVSGGADIVDATQNTYYSSRLEAFANAREGGNALESLNKSTSLLNENLLQYDQVFGDRHDLDVQAGFTWQKEIDEGQFLQNSNFVSDDNGVFGIGNGNQANGPTVGSFRNESTLLSWLSRANYAYGDKYLLTLTARADGSSRFGEGNKWGLFPSGALAWRISSEPFMQNQNVFSNLKLRLSYGITGNQEIGLYQSLGRLSGSPTVLGQSTVIGFSPVGIANPNLRWETTSQFDVGLDMGFFDQRLRLTADYYYKNTDDLLLNVTLPQSSGFTSALQNSGSLQNQGVELSLQADLFTSQPFRWNANANFSANRNEVTDLGESDRFFGSPIVNKAVGGLVEVGRPVGVYYGYATDGIFADQAEIDAYGAQPGAQPGDIKFVDTNGDGQVSEDDRTVIGNPYPDFSFGLSNTLSYKGFELSTFLQGVVGSDVMHIGRRATEYLPLKVNITERRFEGRWTPENPEGATFPRVDYELSNSRLLNDRFVEDGSYLRLKNIALSYNLPTDKIGFLTNAGFRNARVYVKGVDLFTITDYTGFSPDVNTQGQDTINRSVDVGAYPTYRQFIFGVEVGL